MNKLHRGSQASCNSSLKASLRSAGLDSSRRCFYNCVCTSPICSMFYLILAYRKLHIWITIFFPSTLISCISFIIQITSLTKGHQPWLPTSLPFGWAPFPLCISILSHVHTCPLFCIFYTHVDSLPLFFIGVFSYERAYTFYFDTLVNLINQQEAWDVYLPVPSFFLSDIT